MKSKVMHYGANRPITISISEEYWQVLFAMTQLSGVTPEEWCRGAIESDIYIALDNPEEFGRYLCDGWRETLDRK